MTYILMSYISHGSCASVSKLEFILLDATVSLLLVVLLTFLGYLPAVAQTKRGHQ